MIEYKIVDSYKHKFIKIYRSYKLNWSLHSVLILTIQKITIKGTDMVIYLHKYHFQSEIEKSKSFKLPKNQCTACYFYVYFCHKYILQ